MEREKDKAGLVSETFEASLGKRMVVHLRPPNHPTTQPPSWGVIEPPAHHCQTVHHLLISQHSTSTAQAQAQDKHKPSASEQPPKAQVHQEQLQ